MDYLERSHSMLAYETEKWNDGISFIAGIDEVGRGPLAGPVVAAAVVFDKRAKIPAVNDSKKLTEKQQNIFYDAILNCTGIQFSIATVQVEIIDDINILQATCLAMRQALENLNNVEFALIDGRPVQNFPIPNISIIKGDSKSASIAAASIIAKVYRDNLMSEYSLQYPEYSFDKNKGYGTADHLKAIEKLGPCPIHRKTFAPVKDYYITDKIHQPLLDFKE